MAERLKGKQIAILATHGFEQSELTEPKRLLEAEGARVSVVSPAKEATIKGWKEKNWGDAVAVDIPLDEADPASFDALVLPDGEAAVAALARDGHTMEFIKDQYRHGKAILVLPASATLLKAAGVSATLPSGEADPGVVSGGDVETFIAAIARHRHPERETDPPQV